MHTSFQMNAVVDSSPNFEYWNSRHGLKHHKQIKSTLVLNFLDVDVDVEDLRTQANASMSASYIAN